jgi:hypothetical protein
MTCLRTCRGALVMAARLRRQVEGLGVEAGHGDR